MTFQFPLNVVQSLLITSFFTSNLINLKCTLEKIQYRENICTSVLSYFTLYGLSGQAKLLRAGASCKCFIRQHGSLPFMQNTPVETAYFPPLELCRTNLVNFCGLDCKAMAIVELLSIEEGIYCGCRNQQPSLYTHNSGLLFTTKFYSKFQQIPIL